MLSSRGARQTMQGLILIRADRAVVALLTSTVYVSSHFIPLKRREFLLPLGIRYRRQMATGSVQVLNEHNVR